MKSYWECKAEKIERRRLLIARAVVCLIYSILIAATVWAVCALVSIKREEVRLEQDSMFAHYQRVFLTGGRE